MEVHVKLATSYITNKLKSRQRFFISLEDTLKRRKYCSHIVYRTVNQPNESTINNFTYLQPDGVTDHATFKTSLKNRLF